MDEDTFIKAVNKFYINKETTNKRGHAMQLFTKNSIDTILSSLESLLNNELLTSAELVNSLSRNTEIQEHITKLITTTQKFYTRMKNYKKEDIQVWMQEIKVQDSKKSRAKSRS